MHAGLSPRTVVRPTRSPAICGDPRPGSASSAARRDRQGGAENGQGIERFAGPWSRPRPTRGPRGPAGLLAIRNAGRQRSRVVLREDRRARDQDADHQGQRHDFCHVPSAPGVARIAGPTSMLLTAEVRDLAGGNAALVRVIQASRRCRRPQQDLAAVLTAGCRGAVCE